MFTSFPPNEWKLPEKRKWPPNIKLSRGSMSSELCKLPCHPSHSRIFDERCTKEVALRCIESALSNFNEQSPSKQGPKYELVDALDCLKDSKMGVYHCNFIARLQNDKEAQDKLFFAELLCNEGPVLRCTLCCILGPRGTESGQYGCKSCQRHPGLIQHPKDRFSRNMMLSCEAGHHSGLWNLGLIFGKVDSSQSLEEIKFSWPETASTSSKHPHPVDGNDCNIKLPYSSSIPSSFGGRCREDTILLNAECALSSFNEQNISKKFGIYRGSFDGSCPGWLAEAALSSFNEQSLSKQGPEYELVDVQNFIVLRVRGIYHCNFIARLKNESKAEDKLFFAELGFCGTLRCHLCCILGPRGTVTGEYGCMSCLRRPGLVHHPEDGFSKVFEDVRADAGRSMLSREADHRAVLWSSEKISGMVIKSPSREEIKFPSPEGASTLSKHPHPDDGNFINSKLPYSPSLPTFGRCREDTFPENADSALSSFSEQTKRRKTPSFGKMFSTYEFCIRPGSFGGICPPWLSEPALSCFNEQSLSKQGPEYDIVDVLNFTVHRKRGIYHCNFIARPKNGSKAEDELFFAELEFCEILRCNLCCILGPSGTVTGENGCMSCLRRPGLVHHPEDGFSKVFEDVRADAGSSILPREADHGSDLGSSEKISGMVDTSHYREAIKFPLPESSSTLSKHPHPDDGHCCNSKLPYSPPLPTSFGRCREDIFRGNADSALSSFSEQDKPRKTPSFGKMFSTYEFCIRPGSFGGICPAWLSEPALSSFNEQSLYKQGPEYEIVDVLNFTVHRKRGIYHCNFIARPNNGSKAEDKLFFAELEFCEILRCNLCCILGPSGTVTGENGCMSCLRRPGLVHHPEDGFSKVFEDVRADAGPSILSREADHGSGLESSEKISGM